MENYYVSKVTTKGQVTIPSELRNYLKVKEGDYILFEKKGSKIDIKKMAPSQDFKDFARSVRERFQNKEIVAEDVEEAIKWARSNSNENNRRY